MKSVKPGRGPSLLAALAGVAAAAFGVIWIFGALKMGAPIFMALFGIAFVVIAILGVIYNAHNATAENRYSEFDITDDGEEPDPLSKRVSSPPRQSAETAGEKGAFCPFCGKTVQSDFAFCPHCGKRLP